MLCETCIKFNRTAFLVLIISLFRFSNAFGHKNLNHRFSTTMKESLGRMNTRPQEEGESNDSITRSEASVFAKKFHHISVCMVPPIHDNITKARTELRDPGLFRWPPHANLLYPFINIDSSDTVIQRLEDATRLIEPFRCKIEKFGTFGGNNRGVLFLYPRSYYDHQRDENETEPLIDLQSILMQSFPECKDQLKHGSFTPHITLSHFTSIEKALEGQKAVEEWWEPIEFSVTEIYCLIRKGDDGQFKRLLTLPLGSNNAAKLHDPPLPFPEMPLEEEDWILEERMKLKERRNNNGRRRNRRVSSDSNRNQKTATRGPSRSKDTPEEIAKKRAERAAKKALLSREAASIAAAIEMDKNTF